MRWLKTLSGFFITACLAAATPAFCQLSVQIASSEAAPNVGDPVTFTATASDPNPGGIDYQFSVSINGAALQTIVDFSSYNSIVWAPSMQEGNYVMLVTARNKTAGDSGTSQVSLNVQSRVTGNAATISATANPLVALYSAPPCPAGRRISVAFGTRGIYSQTDQRSCNGALSTNFYIAGMLPNTTYQMYSVLSAGLRRNSVLPVNYSQSVSRVDLSATQSVGPIVEFTTGSIPTSLAFATPTVLVAPNAQADSDQNILLNDSVALDSYLSGAYYFPTATDLYGNVLWYYSTIGTLAQSTDYFIRPIPGGTLLLIAADPNTVAVKGQILREIDLAGNTTRETNVTRISEQLADLGMLGITDFDHDAIRLPNGHTLVICAQEKVFPAGTQGSSSSIDLIGNAIVDLDANLQVVWAWSGYDHLDVNRAAVLGETCLPNQSGCSPIFLASSAADWLHGNSLDYVPATGDILFSMRHQDWVAKIDYANGTGSGNVVWELGKDGAFNFASSDPYPWFAHQHDVEYELQGDTVLSLFDNGNTREALNPTIRENSRGMVLLLDEAARTAMPLLLQDLGVSSNALGSAQRLDNGDYHFDAGFVFEGTNQVALHLEYSLTGSQNYVLQTNDIAYRSYRMVSMYLTDGTGN